jgi:hypothetical protein
MPAHNNESGRGWQGKKLKAVASSQFSVSSQKNDRRQPFITTGCLLLLSLSEN